MKHLPSLVVCLSALAGATPGAAQWAVLDVAALQQSVTNYSAMVEQLSRQATQISNQVQQIRQYETQLKRLGDMASVKNLVGFSEFRLDLDLPTQIKGWSDNVARVDGRGLFGDTRGGIYPQITVTFPDFDGGTVDRDAQTYKRAHDLVAAVDGFKVVQDDVYMRREELKRAIARTSDALQAAETEAEQKKLAAVLVAQYGQLAAVDDEVTLSAAEVQTKQVEAEAMKTAHNEAEAEARQKLAQQEAGKVMSAFKPTYECLLQYVSERRLNP
jgi:phage shock protein A